MGGILILGVVGIALGSSAAFADADGLYEFAAHTSGSLARGTVEPEEKVTLNVKGDRIRQEVRGTRAVRTGHFREDLYYRLKVVPIHLLPLRERPEDIPLLAERCLRSAKEGEARSPREVRRIMPEALDLLLRYPWPGNVRELENAIERALLFCHGETIGPEHPPPEVRHHTETIRLGLSSDSLCLREALGRMARETERSLIRRALDRARGNRTQAARLLGISRRALLYKLREMAGRRRS